MQKLACAFVVVLAACGSDSGNKVHVLSDAGGSAVCDPLGQSGCADGEKCTWIYDQVPADGTNIFGHVGCAPDGDKNPHEACTRNAAGQQGWDDCKAGSYCKAKRELTGVGGAGICEAICDNNGSEPKCADDTSCVIYNNTFTTNNVAVAGICDNKCDPFLDNDALRDGSAEPHRLGSACQSYEECIGHVSNKPLPTGFSCSREYNTDLHHRHKCGDGDGNSLNNPDPLGRVGCTIKGAPVGNGCAEGYQPFFYETTGTTNVVCTAMCKPKSCWNGHCGSDEQSSALAGDPAGGHQCKPANIIVNDSSTQPAQLGSNGANGDQCVFTWRFEIGSGSQDNGHIYVSDFSDTTGWCRDATKYQYDANQDGTADTTLPKCDTLTDPTLGSGSAIAGVCNSDNGCLGAAFFGCTSLEDSGLATFQNGTRVLKKLTNRFATPLGMTMGPLDAPRM